MKRTPLLPASILVLFLSNLVCAQEKENELDPVTVTNAYTPQRASHTGRNMLTISGERIAALPVHSIDELLRYLPGIEIQSRGPMGSQSDIVIRGGTFQQVLVLIDGVRLNDPNTGHFASYIPIAPAEIERIEILKGAASAAYGSEAVGGVVQIITKTFSGRRNVQGFNIHTQLTGGQHDAFLADAGGYFSNGTTAFSAGIQSNNTAGQLQRGTHGSLYANTASFSFSHYLNEHWQLKMRYAYDDQRFAAQNFYTNFISDTATERIISFWNQFGIDYQNKKNTLSLTLGYKDLEDQYRFNTVSIPNKNNSKLFQALLTDQWKLKEGTTITTGAQFLSKKIVSNDRGNHHLDEAAIFAMLNQQLARRFFVNPALRLEWNEGWGWELVPQLNLSYRNANWQLRGSAGKTIRDADFTERYNNYQKIFVSGGRIGNPDLRPEHSFSWEAGADYFFPKHFKLSGGFFQRRHSQLIDYVPTAYNDMPRKYNLSPTGSYALAKNISEVRTNGVEAEALYSSEFARNRKLWISAGITWMKSKSSEAVPSFYILSHARWLGNFSIQYTTRHYSFGLNGLYKKRAPQSSSAAIAQVSARYFVLNLKGEAFVWRHLLSVFAEADNIFNRQYADLLGAQMPGRWIMGGIKISLSK